LSSWNADHHYSRTSCIGEFWEQTEETSSYGYQKQKIYDITHAFVIRNDDNNYVGNAEKSAVI
jgi:hypothetical protein